MTPAKHAGCALGFLEEELAALAKAGLSRTLEPLAGPQGPVVTLATGERLVSFCSNDYLALAGDPRLVAAAREALERFGVGTGASRLIAGDLTEHEALEAELAKLKGAEAALVFGSGWHANTGTIPALVGEGDLVISDELNHASLIDGARLSRARIVVVPHADPAAVERALATTARRKLVLTDGLFSMDGDRAPLRELRASCDRHGAILYVDEAHATGVLGPTGGGACEEAGIRADVAMGTLGKALGSFGAFVAGPAALRAFLLSRARGFVFTTGLPAALCSAAREALRIVRDEPERRERLAANARRLAAGCEALGLHTRGSRSAIVPVILGNTTAALDASAALRARGFLVRAIRPPTVPSGSSRLRLAVSAGHTAEQVDGLLEALAGSLPRRRASGER